MSRILIVEDDPAILCGLRDNLEFESHEVLTAADGEAGYQAVRDHAPELVILDLMLPKLSGYDLCRRVRGEGYHAPILMLSARSQESDRVVGLDLGANDYVSKPFSLRELLARVRALLRHEREHQLDEGHLGYELEVAAKVQQRLFPRILPKVPGLDYAAICRPARGVSGDYYDFLSLGDGKLGLLLADVSGKGMPAALLGASLQAVVRADAPSAGDRCGELLAKASSVLFETTTPERYATLFYGVYDPITRVLTYANAGHHPPMLVRERTAIRMGSLTPPAGLLSTLPVRQEHVQLFPGDWLLIFSDGIPEAADGSGEEFGDDRLIEALCRLRGGTPAEMCEGIVDEVRDHLSEQRQQDDITLIAVKVW
jgi:serine phosphatase RsbU (regulator of sigma subunit)